jgi:multiple sugar transport system ATP-binding protein
MNLLPATVVAADAASVTVVLAGGRQVRAAVDGSGRCAGECVTLGLRPEHACEMAVAGAGAAAFHGTVGMVEHLGEVNHIYVTLDDGSEVVVRGDGNQMLRSGAPISFGAPAEAFHLFDGNGRALRRLQPGNMVSSRAVRGERAAAAAAVGSLA